MRQIFVSPYPRNNSPYSLIFSFEQQVALSQQSSRLADPIRHQICAKEQRLRVEKILWILWCVCHLIASLYHTCVLHFSFLVALVTKKNWLGLDQALTDAWTTH